MRILLIILLSIEGFIKLSSQQWIDKKHSYDSILNISYGSSIDFAGDLIDHKMDIFLPVCKETLMQPRPLMLIIHGGAFLAGNKNESNIQYLCKQFARRGYVTATISYRLGFISDDLAWNCVYPNYSCVFASDSAEWVRSYYRAIQDGKGALRFLMNRHQQFNIDLNNIFVAGESAGSFVALGIALMDSELERPIQTRAIADATIPNANTSTCIYRQNKIFTKPIPRPDLEGIEGTIEPSNLSYTIRGVGNMYGAMLTDLLKHHSSTKPKPGIYSFHQPCDIVVPIDSGVVYQGLSWCLTNGYNCFGIQNNNIKLYGSRAFSSLNKKNNYGYNILDEFTSTEFPYNFLFGKGSCADQVNAPCHAYDNIFLRENNMAKFFATLISNNTGCKALNSVSNQNLISECISNIPKFIVDHIQIQSLCNENYKIEIYNSNQTLINSIALKSFSSIDIESSQLKSGMYFIKILNKNGNSNIKKIIKI